MKNIAILGCGWLGLPLAKSLVAKGYSVKGSTTHDSKLDTIKSHGIEPYKIELESWKVVGNVEKFLEDVEILIINVPPRLRDVIDVLEESYERKVSYIFPYVEKAKVKKLLFVSSTSVYGNIDGEVNEQTPLNPITVSSEQIVLLEKNILSNKNFTTTILRFSGLTGADRNPAYFLAGKTNILNPQAPINLIHLDDCIGIIEKIIEKEYWGAILNAAAPYHPQKNTFYINKAKALGLPLPRFNNSGISVGKKIDSSKLMKELDYEFKVIESL
jgi:nucleoside-diphosphate-sugar epimerase